MIPPTALSIPPPRRPDPQATPHLPPLFATVLVLALLLTALAAPTADPAPYFTVNLTPPPVGAVTTLEQALLDRIAGAHTSIDAALYDFDPPYLRDALLAAHAHGVQIRIVTDNKARANPSYAPYYQALTAVGIPVVDAPVRSFGPAVFG